MIRMPKYDGSVKINTAIDTDGFYAGIKKMTSSTMQLKNSIQNTTNQVSKLENEIKQMESSNEEPKSVTRLQEKLKQTETDVLSLQNEMKSLSDSAVKTDEYEFLADSLDKAKVKLEQLNDRQDKMSATGVKESSKQWKNLQYDIDRVKQEIAYTEAEMSDMRLSGEAFKSGAETNQYASLDVRLQEVTAKQRRYNSELQNAIQKENLLKADKLSAKREQLNQLNEKLAVYNRKLEEARKKESGLGSNLKQLKNASASLGKMVIGGSRASGALSGLSGILGTMSSRMNGLLMSAFIFNAISKGANSLREKLVDCLAVNDDYNNSLKQIKGNLATAFYPIYTYVLPAINTLMNWLNKVTGTLAVFSSKLFGGSVSQNQQGAKALLQRAEAVKKVGQAAEKASGSLSEIDDMHILQSGSNSSGSDSVSQDYNFGEVQTNPELEAWLDRMKTKFEPVINAINDLVDAAAPLAGPFLEGFIDGLTEIVTSEFAVSVIEWIADALKDMSPEDAEKLGKAFGEMAAAFVIISGVIGAVTAISGLIAALASSSVALGAVAGILTFLAGWKIGNGIYELITGEKVDMTMWEQLDEIFSTLLFDSETFFDALGWMIYDSYSAFLGCFGIDAPTWSESKQAVKDGLKVFKDAFSEKGIMGIVEVAADTLMYCLGVDSETWKSAKQGITDMVNKYKTAFQKDGISGIVKQAFQDIRTSVSNTLSASWIGNLFHNMISNVKNKFNGVATSIGKSVGDSFSAGINGVLRNIESIINGFIRNINSVRLLINKIPGVNINRIETISLPRLATGTVVPANYGEFKAILGDNKREPEIVSPLSTMRQAVREELNANGGSGGRIIRIQNILNLDGKVIYQSVVDYNEAEIDRTGNNPLFA